MDKTVREAALLFGAVHFVCGGIAIVEPAVLKVSSLAVFYWIFSDHSTTAGAALMCVGALAIIGSRMGLSDNARLWLVGPQQLVLVLQIISISHALAVQHFPDGYVPEGKGLFILADQLLFWAMSAAHSAMYLADITRTRGGR